MLAINTWAADKIRQKEVCTHFANRLRILPKRGLPSAAEPDPLSVNTSASMSEPWTSSFSERLSEFRWASFAFLANANNLFENIRICGEQRGVRKIYSRGKANEIKCCTYSSSCLMNEATQAASLSKGCSKTRRIQAWIIAIRSATNSVVNFSSCLSNRTRLWGIIGIMAPGTSTLSRS